MPVFVSPIRVSIEQKPENDLASPSESYFHCSILSQWVKIETRSSICEHLAARAKIESRKSAGEKSAINTRFEFAT